VKSQLNPELSIIVAVYNEDPRNLLKLIDRIDQVLKPEMVSYELIFVNDGSREPTTNALRHIAVESKNIKLVELSRNFGQQAAITAGLDHSEGQSVVNMDSDLQDPPELIPAMLEKWKEGYDVVYATRSKRRDRKSKRITAFLFYRLLGAISTVEIPWDTGDFRLMDRVVVNALQAMPEKTRFIRGMIPWLGFKQCGVPLDRDAREIGESAYTIKKLLSLALDGMLSFSSVPLFFISGFGAVLTTFSAIAFIIGFVTDPAAAGLLVISAMGFFSGLQIMMLGIISVYLAKVLDETRARPTYVVGKRLGGGFANADIDRTRLVKDTAATSYSEQTSATALTKS